jgi:type IV pilus assembly protein PilZ
MDDPASGEGGEGERRESSRPPIELKVEYKKLNTFFADYTRNISKGGTFIRTRKPLDEGTEFVFKLIVPRLEQPIAIRGAVKWVVRENGAPAAGDPGMGIRFLYGSEVERRSVEAIVERLMIDSLGQLIYSKLMDRRRSGTHEAQPAPADKRGEGG